MFVSYLRRVLCKPRQKTFYKVYKYFFSCEKRWKCRQMEMLTTEWPPRSDSPVREAKTGISSVSPAYRGIKMEWLWSERPLTDRSKNEYPAKPRGGVRGLQMTGAVIRFQLSHAKTTNEIQICFSITSHTKTKNEIQTSIQSDAKTKNEIHIRLSKWWEHEKRNFYPFFKVMKERRTKSKIQICFSMSCKNEKRKMEMEFECHFPMPLKNGWH